MSCPRASSVLSSVGLISDPASTTQAGADAASAEPADIAEAAHRDKARTGMAEDRSRQHAQEKLLGHGYIPLSHFYESAVKLKDLSSLAERLPAGSPRDSPTEKHVT